VMSMPYIEMEQRAKFDNMELQSVPMLANEGGLNYAITSLVDEWLRLRGVNYKHLNAAIGVLECAKLELYRRVAAPYEDKKIIENGDVYSGSL